MKKLLLLIAISLIAIPAWGAELTTEQRGILAHVVVDADAWATHSLAVDPSGKALTAKIAKYRADYLTKKDVVGYKTRAERDAAAVEAAKPTAEQILATTKEKLIKGKMRKQAIDALIAEGKLTDTGELPK